VKVLTGESPGDAKLLTSIEAGDRTAFETLYLRYAAWLMLRLRYRCADDALVDDVVQETFLAVWRGTAKFRDQPQGDVAGWLWRIGCRRLVDALRDMVPSSDCRRCWLDDGRAMSRRQRNKCCSESNTVVSPERPPGCRPGCGR
jgi:hypothetical protein